VTGVKNPRGMKSRLSSTSETPASTRMTPVAGSNASTRLAMVALTTLSPARAGSDASP
jgi:hypothetical protein